MANTKIDDLFVSSITHNFFPGEKNVSKSKCLLYDSTHLFFFFFLFRATPATYGSSPARGQVGATAAGLHHSHGNTGSLTHWVGPEIQPASSWFLVGFLNHWATKGTPYAPLLFSVESAVYIFFVPVLIFILHLMWSVNE